MRHFLFFLILFICSIGGFSESFSYEEITIIYQKGNQKIARQLAPPFYRNIVRFQKKIGLYTIVPVTVQILADDAEIDSKQGIIEFSDAFYNRKKQIIFVKNPKIARRFTRLQEILLHEYIHHFIDFHYPNAPLWFHEGMAVYFSDGISYQRKLHFVKDKILGNSLPLKEMTHKYPENSIQWQSFYAKSALAVQFLLTHKKEEFYQLWEQASRTNDFNRSFLNAFFMSTQDFSHHFENYANKHFRIELLLASSTIIWALFPILFFIGLFRRRKQEKEIQTRWEEQEFYERI